VSHPLKHLYSKTAQAELNFSVCLKVLDWFFLQNVMFPGANRKPKGGLKVVLASLENINKAII